MANINDLYNHFNELIKLNINNILLDMIKYGNSNSTATVTLYFKPAERLLVFGDNLGCFLFDANRTYSSKEDMKSNVSYSSLLPFPQDIEIEHGNKYINSDNEFQFVIDNVAQGTYYVVVSEVDGNNLPFANEGNPTRIVLITTNSSHYENYNFDDDEWKYGLSYYDVEDSATISIPNENDNTWYCRTDA